jgi:two-component system, OmpR family, response regulator
MKALVVEDDARIAQDVAAALGSAGFVTEWSSAGQDAWFRGGTEVFDLIVLDLGLPQMDGLSVLRAWRSEGCNVPVLVLSARGTWAERVEGINAGADDYLPKPFRLEELVARARALVRRAAGRGMALESVGELTVEMSRMEVAIAGRPIAMTPLEFRLLAYLVLHRSRVVSPTELLDHLYSDGDSRGTNAVEALVVRLRRKLGSGVIDTRRGFGYQIKGVAG